MCQPVISQLIIMPQLLELSLNGTTASHVIDRLILFVIQVRTNKQLSIGERDESHYEQAHSHTEQLMKTTV